MSELDLQVEFCRRRQRRLLDEMHKADVELAIITRLEHVQWLVGPHFRVYFEPIVALRADGHVTLIAPNRFREEAAADEVVRYDAQLCSTLRNDQRAASAAILFDALKGQPKPKRLGVEFSLFGPHLSDGFDAELVDLEPTIYYLRRRKEADELARIRKAIAATGAMYRRAREIIEPGINELRVFSELQAAAVEEFGEMTTATGNDYACGAHGGPPRDRAAEDGELYILDLGPAFRGYFSDNCRAIAVNRQPTDAQLAAWQQLAEVFPLVERTVRPGRSCRALYEEVKAMLDDYMPGSFTHHLGHGIGLNPHEAPHVNPNWDEVFEEGDVFTIEPGLYAPDLRAGIRLENDYLVTADGVELLSDFPLELVV